LEKNGSDWECVAYKDHDGKRWNKNGKRNSTLKKNDTNNFDGPKNWTTNETNDFNQNQNESSDINAEDVWDEDFSDWECVAYKDQDGERWNKNGIHNGTNNKNDTDDFNRTEKNRTKNDNHRNGTSKNESDSSNNTKRSDKNKLVDLINEEHSSPDLGTILLFASLALIGLSVVISIGYFKNKQHLKKTNPYAETR